MSKEYTNDLLMDFGNDNSRLIPVVTQDYNTKDVLILSFTNKDAFNETLESGYATYYSRTRKEIWRKGYTSGNFLKIKEIRVNCEQNSLLYLVTPEGDGVCHAQKKDGTHYSTCYYRQLMKDGKLKVLKD